MLPRPAFEPLIDAIKAFPKEIAFTSAFVAEAPN